MKLAVVSDIHGNANALNNVVACEPNDMMLVQLGDVVGLNAQPKQVVKTLHRLEPQSVVMLKGNHGKAIFHKNKGHVNSDELSRFEREHTIEMLSGEQIEWMKGLSYFDAFTSNNERVCASHAKPWPEEASGYESGNHGVSKKELPHVASVVADDYDWVLLGHTHQQYEQDCSKFGHDVHFVNSGSLGYNGDYATIDLESGEVELKSVDFDENKVKEHISSVLPDYAPPVARWF